MRIIDTKALDVCVSRFASRGRRPSNTLHSSSGFTLIEILVASLLLGMLMTILTMVFNSSAIAWRTGRASNAKMSLARKQLSYAQYLADNALPRIDQANPSASGRVLGAWDKKGDVRRRAVEVFSDWNNYFNTGEGNAGSGTPPQNWGSDFSSLDDSIKPWAGAKDIQDIQIQGGHSYLVGVHSWGPDGKQNTMDDINTMPVTVE